MSTHTIPPQETLAISYQDADGDDITFDTDEEWKEYIEQGHSLVKLTLRRIIPQPEFEQIVERLVQVDVQEFPSEMHKSFGVEPQVQPIHAQADVSQSQDAQSIHLMPIEDGHYIKVSTTNSSTSSVHEPSFTAQEKGKDVWNEPQVVPPPKPIRPNQALVQRSQWQVMVESFQRLFGLHPEFFPNLKQAILKTMNRVSSSTKQAYRHLLHAVEEGYQRATYSSSSSSSTKSHPQATSTNSHPQATRSSASTSISNVVSDMERLTVTAIENLTYAVNGMFHPQPYPQQATAMSTHPRGIESSQRGVCDALWNLTTTTAEGVNMASRRFNKDLKSAKKKYCKLLVKKHSKKQSESTSVQQPMASTSHYVPENTYYAPPPSHSPAISSEQGYPINYPYGQVPPTQPSLYPDLSEKHDPHTYPATESTLATLPRYTTKAHDEAPAYHYQLQTLESMGFLDSELNYILLKQCQGDLNKVISFLSS